MRKPFFFIGCILLACSVHAQIYITPEGGLNRSQFSTTASTNQVIVSPINGFQAGALVSKTWEKTKSVFDYLFFQTGLELAQKGSYQGRGAQSVYGSNSTITLNYLQAPLNIGLNIPVYHGLGVMASAGLYLAYGISGTDKGTLQDVSGARTIDRNIKFTNDAPGGDINNTYIKPFDNGYNLSAGITYKNFLLKTTYTLGTENNSPVSTTRYLNETWNFSLAYSFRVRMKMKAGKK